MPPTIHLIRHAEGVHNLNMDNLWIRDPDLTDRGREQVRCLAARLAALEEVEPESLKMDLVLASPLRRTLFTALGAFGPQLARGQPAKVRALPDLQEVSDLPCDSGSPLEEILMEFGAHAVDFDLVEEGWEQNQGRYDNTAQTVAARAKAARQWLKTQPHENVAVVTHGCFLHFLTEDWEGSDSAGATSWGKAEMRSYTFAEDDEDDALYETAKSRAGRECGPVLNQEEQAQIQKGTLKTWTEWKILK